MLKTKVQSLLVTVCIMASLCAILVQTHPMTSKATEDNTRPDPESLPPDTFRQLAQVLYRRGDKVENRLTRKFFYNSSVTCNDGTVAGYYIRRNYQSKRWVIYLEGKFFDL